MISDEGADAIAKGVLGVGSKDPARSSSILASLDLGQVQTHPAQVERSASGMPLCTRLLA